MRRRAGWLAGLVGIMAFAVLADFSLLGWSALTRLLSEFVKFTCYIVFAFGLGLWLTDRIAKVILGMNATQKRLVAMLARVAIVALALANVLRRMGLANEIINPTFGLTLGAIAVAPAIAFGVGG